MLCLEIMTTTTKTTYIIQSKILAPVKFLYIKEVWKDFDTFDADIREATLCLRRLRREHKSLMTFRLKEVLHTESIIPI